MTLGVLLGIIVLLVILVKMTKFKYFRLTDFLSSIFLSAIVGLVVCSIVSIIGGSVLKIIYKDDIYNTVNEQTIEVMVAKIDIIGKYNNTTVIIYTSSDMETNTISLSQVKLVNEDIENPYIIKRTLESKCHFVTHILDKTEYEYHGNIEELYD